MSSTEALLETYNLRAQDIRRELEPLIEFSREPRIDHLTTHSRNVVLARLERLDEMIEELRGPPNATLPERHASVMAQVQRERDEARQDLVACEARLQAERDGRARAQQEAAVAQVERHTYKELFENWNVRLSTTVAALTLAETNLQDSREGHAEANARFNCAQDALTRTEQMLRGEQQAHLTTVAALAAAQAALEQSAMEANARVQRPAGAFVNAELELRWERAAHGDTVAELAAAREEIAALRARTKKRRWRLPWSRRA